MLFISLSPKAFIREQILIVASMLFVWGSCHDWDWWISALFNTLLFVWKSPGVFCTEVLCPPKVLLRSAIQPCPACYWPCCICCNNARTYGSPSSLMRLLPSFSGSESGVFNWLVEHDWAVLFCAAFPCACIVCSSPCTRAFTEIMILILYQSFFLASHSLQGQDILMKLFSIYLWVSLCHYLSLSLFLLHQPVSFFSKIHVQSCTHLIPLEVSRFNFSEVLIDLEDP